MKIVLMKEKDYSQITETVSDQGSSVVNNVKFHCLTSVGFSVIIHNNKLKDVLLFCMLCG